MQDRRMSVRVISEAVGISIGTVDTILTEDLKLHKACAKFVPEILSKKISGGSTRTMPHITSQSW